MSLIAISGGDGTIGRHLPNSCLRVESRLESDDATKITELKKSSQPITRFIHLAGMVSTAQCQSHPDKAYQYNVEGSLSWWRALESMGCRRFVFVSSSHVYAPPQDKKPLSVESPLGPAAVYGQSKLEAEKRLTELSQNSKMELIIARVFSVLSDPAPSWSLRGGLNNRALKADFAIPCLDCVRDFLWDYQVAARLQEIATASSSPAILNVCSGRPTTIREIASKIFQENGQDPEKLFDPGPFPPTNPWVVGYPNGNSE